MRRGLVSGCSASHIVASVAQFVLVRGVEPSKYNVIGSWLNVALQRIVKGSGTAVLLRFSAQTQASAQAAADGLLRDQATTKHQSRDITSPEQHRGKERFQVVEKKKRR
jgi:hypothetical protein